MKRRAREHQEKYAFLLEFQKSQLWGKQLNSHFLANYESTFSKQCSITLKMVLSPRPLIVMCGKPCSGKTRIANQLMDYIKQKGVDVELINVESLQLESKTAYGGRACSRCE